MGIKGNFLTYGENINLCVSPEKPDHVLVKCGDCSDSETTSGELWGKNFV